MQRVPIGIDLGTTYSCISHLDRQGEPHTLPNPEGELTTPSIVLFEGRDIVVGTEALRNSVMQPDRVVQHAKRYMGDPKKSWVIDGRVYRPVDISAIILRHLLDGAEQHVGPIEHAVITVPAQFSDIQRQQTAEAGMKAGLKKVDIINEPVAAALCYVLGEGMWFAELADDQTVMVYDLGGGTFDLSLVRYNRTEVRVRASSGDLSLGGLDWNKRLENFACDEFIKQVPNDPRLEKESLQALSIEVEQVKRSLSARQRASLTVQHAGRRKVFGVTQEQFELLTHDLVDRTEQITQKLLKDNKLGWAHVNAVLVTGGASRMPMVRRMLQRISGSTLNQTLSPDQSISHGAAYYAGMLASGTEFSKASFLNKDATARLATFKSQSVSARALGILVKDKQTGERVPHYLIPANTPLPCAYRQSFGTVEEDQRRVHLHIVESGTSDEQPPVKLGACIVEDLPEGLPLATPIEVTIRYDEQARVHVSAVEQRSGKSARTSIVREENLVTTPGEQPGRAEVSMMPGADRRPPVVESPTPPPPSSSKSSTFRPARPGATPVQAKPPKPPAEPSPSRSVFVPAAKGSGAAAPKRPGVKPVPPPLKPSVEDADRPVPLCNQCGEALDVRGVCTACGAKSKSSGAIPAARPKTPVRKPVPAKRPATPSKPTAQRSLPPLPPDTDELSDLAQQPIGTPGGTINRRPAAPKRMKPPADDSYEILD
jgi:molecular chaperone DnaK